MPNNKKRRQKEPPIKNVTRCRSKNTAFAKCHIASCRAQKLLQPASNKTKGYGKINIHTQACPLEEKIPLL